MVPEPVWSLASLEALRAYVTPAPRGSALVTLSLRNLHERERKKTNSLGHCDQTGLRSTGLEQRASGYLELY